MKKALAFLLLIALASLPAFSGGQSGAAKIPTIRFMSDWTLDGPAGAPVVLRDILEKSKDFANVIYEPVPGGDDLFTKIQTEAAAGDLPDIFTYWPGSRLNVLIDGDLVADAEEYVKESETLTYDAIDESVWNLFRWKDYLGGVPLEMITGAFLVNRELFEKYGLEYPKTYEEMVAVGKVFRQNDIIPFAMASFEGNPSHFWITVVQFQYEGGVQDVLDMDQTYQFDTPRSRIAAKMMAQMKVDGLYPKDTMSNGQWDPCTALYIERKAAMIFTYPWMYGAFEPDLAEITDIIDVPVMPGATVDPHSAINGESNYGICISKKAWNDPNKREAIRKIVDMWVSKEACMERSVLGSVPTRNDVPLDNLPPLVTRILDFQRDSGKYPSHFHKTVYNPAVVEFQYALDELFAGTIDADEYVDRVQAVFDEGKAQR